MLENSSVLCALLCRENEILNLNFPASHHKSSFPSMFFEEASYVPFVN